MFLHPARLRLSRLTNNLFPKYCDYVTIILRSAWNQGKAMRERQKTQSGDAIQPAQHRPPKPGKPGDRLVFWGSLLLLVWALYELSVRLEAAWPPLKMFIDMAIGERIPLPRVMRYVDFSIFTMPLYLLGCVLLGALSFVFRKRPFAAVVFVPLAITAIFVGTQIDGLFSIGLLKAVKAIPPALVTAGYITNITQLLYCRHMQKKNLKNTGMPAEQQETPPDA
jgi:hypothetical protein